MKVVVSLSGGMDSTTLLALLLQERQAEVAPIFFNYGSKHNAEEIKAVRAVTRHYGTGLEVFNLVSTFGAFKSNLLKGQGAIPEGHYQADNMSLTVVPGRNLIFSSVATGYAWSIGARYIALGIHQGDHAIYPDCRPAFYLAMNEAIVQGTDNRVSFLSPFLGLDKTGICAKGLELEVPYGLTRTCYNSGKLACGRCGACQERLEAFRLNRAEDPLLYKEKPTFTK